MRRLGAPKQAVKLMFRTLQSADHKVSMAYGVSSEMYGGDWDTPAQGIEQGNGCGPGGWAAISTPIINMMRAAGHGFYLMMAITMAIIKFVCFAFVDDTDTIHMARDTDTPGEEVMGEMEEVVDMWEGAIRATGGDAGTIKE